MAVFFLYHSLRCMRIVNGEDARDLKKAARGDFAQPMYHAFNEELRTYGIHVETGIFGADMKVDLLNDGPVTILLDSEEW